MLKKLLNLFVTPLAWLLSKANRVTVALFENTCPVYWKEVPGGRICFYCPSALTLFRAKSLLTKEPDTIKWIDSFEKNDILFDIGANVGVYSLYAGLRGARVYAFEPEAQNYAVLNRNIALNNMQDGIAAFNVAVGDSNRADFLYVSSDAVGGALNNFGEQIDFNKKQFHAKYKQAVVSHPVDSLISDIGLPSPDHIKIDVDGLERLVINGSLGTIKQNGLKSLLIELNVNLKEDMEIVGLMEAHGFEVVSKYHAPQYDDSEWSNIFNFIFKRLASNIAIAR